LDDPTDPIVRFFECASPDLKRLALEYAGRVLQASSGPALPAVVDRLVRLWESRVQAYEASPRGGEQLQELRGFGALFASGRFDATWSLGQLDWLIQRHAELHSSNTLFPGGLTHEVLQELEALAPILPAESVRCLVGLLRFDNDDAQAYFWPELSRSIIHSAAQSDDPSAQSQANALVGRLAARRGLWDMG
jgi:hypothetical protein